MEETYTHRQTPPSTELHTGHGSEGYGPPHPLLVTPHPAMQLTMAPPGPYAFRDNSSGVRMEPFPPYHHQLPQMVPEIPPRIFAQPWRATVEPPPPYYTTLHNIVPTGPRPAPAEPSRSTDTEAPAPPPPKPGTSATCSSDNDGEGSHNTVPDDVRPQEPVYTLVARLGATNVEAVDAVLPKYVPYPDQGRGCHWISAQETIQTYEQKPDT